MNKDRIATLLHEPARVAREDLAGLRELRERYPWFTGGHLLLALGENASGDVLFDDTLGTAAAHLPSREVLFDGMHAERVEEDRLAPKLSAAPSLRIDPARTSVAPTTALDRNEIAQRILDQQILETAAAGLYSVEQTPRTPAPAPAPASAPAFNSALAAGALAPAPAPAPAHAPGSRSFLSWLDLAVEPEQPSLPFHTPKTQSGSLQDWLRTDPATGSTPASIPPEEKPPVKPTQTREAIDRFLKQGSPEPRKTEFFSPQQAGKRSIEDALDIVSETLARIHEKQGHWAKAAQMYRRLAARHPDKSGYFAALAEKAEVNLNP